MNDSDQVTRVLAPVEGEEEVFDDGFSPMMPFPTAYLLNRDQEEELCDHAMTRLEQLEGEMGRDVCAGGNWWSVNGISVGDPDGTGGPETTWMGKRLLYDKTFKNEMDWRPALIGGIFAESNLVIPAARRITRQMIARAVNYFFGTTPWFAIYPVGIMDRNRADKADRYVRWKMDQAKLQRTEEQAIERAFVLGEGVAKSAWAQREQIYKTRAEVLVDADGRDILGADGDYIFKDDLWIQESVQNEQTGEVVTSDLMLLKRDGTTPQPEEMTFVEKLITRRIVHYKGPEAKVINYMDFLCPLEAETVQQADCVVHLYDTPLMDLADQWKKSIPAGASSAERIQATRKAVELLRKLAGGGGQSTSAQNSDTVDSASKSGVLNERKDPVVHIAEFHLRYDADGDGILEDVVLIMDRDTRTPIFYDYTANITPDGLRPFSVVRVNEIPGRWYGMGSMEMFNPSQQTIDLLINRKNHAMSRSARVDFWKPHNTIEGSVNPNLDVNWGGTYTPKGDKVAKDCLESLYLTDNIGEALMSLIEFYMQLMMNESGIANANDGNVAGMDSTKLATGIRNIEKSGQELFSLFLGHLEPGVSETLTKMVKILFANLDKMEVYRYFEAGEAKIDPLTGQMTSGEGPGGMIEINPGEIANIEMDTRILLSRYRGEQVIESNARVIELVEKFDSFSYERQVTIAPTFIQMAKQFQCSDAERLFVPIQPIAAPTGRPMDARGMASSAVPRPRMGAANL